MTTRLFTEDIIDTVYAHGALLNGAPIVIGTEVATTCHSLGNAELCHTNCPFWVQCDGGVVNTRIVEVEDKPKKKGRR